MIRHHGPSPQNIKLEFGFPVSKRGDDQVRQTGVFLATRVLPRRSQAAYRLVQSVFPVYRFCPPARLHWRDHLCQPAENHASAK